MPNRLSEEKAQAIAAEYCTNGFQKVMALLAVGYSTSYANKVGLKLYDNDRVKQAVDRIQASTKAKTGYTVENALAEYEEARLLAIKTNQPAAAATATTGKARLYGFDKDHAIGEKTTIVISPRIAPDRPPDRSQQGVKQVESEDIDAQGQG